jgi:hypothetical protein
VTHYTEDELTLYYYGEGRYDAGHPGSEHPRRDVATHLGACASCAALYREISDTLAMIALPDAPVRGDQYGLEVWQRIRHRLPERDAPWWTMPWTVWTPRWDRLALAGTAAVLVMAAFVAGRLWPHQPIAPPSVEVQAPGPATAAANDAVRDRILLTSVADHLDRSARVLTDIMNGPARTDISTEQGWAEDLVTTSRLYRQDAVDAGEQSVATVLDELERNLLEIVHSPSNISAADLEQIRRRIDAAALLFKVRVMSDEIRQREQMPAGRSLPRTSTRKIS